MVDIDPNADMRLIKQMIAGGEPQTGMGGADASEDAGQFERVLNARDFNPSTDHPDAVADQDMMTRAIGNRLDVVKVDPSVHEWETIRQGEPRGSIPMEVTMGRPTAAYPIRRGPK